MLSFMPAVCMSSNPPLLHTSSHALHLLPLRCARCTCTPTWASLPTPDFCCMIPGCLVWIDLLKLFTCAESWMPEASKAPAMQPLPAAVSQQSVLRSVQFGAPATQHSRPCILMHLLLPFSCRACDPYLDTIQSYTQVCCCHSKGQSGKAMNG